MIKTYKNIKKPKILNSQLQKCSFNKEKIINKDLDFYNNNKIFKNNNNNFNFNKFSNNNFSYSNNKIKPNSIKYQLLILVYFKNKQNSPFLTKHNFKKNQK